MLVEGTFPVRSKRRGPSACQSSAKEFKMAEFAASVQKVDELLVKAKAVGNGMTM